jgi:hypothetical protein
MFRALTHYPVLDRLLALDEPALLVAPQNLTPVESTALDYA